MVNIIKDSRKWKVTITLDNENCPYLYYPANYHGCKERGVDDDCTLENCRSLSAVEGGAVKAEGVCPDCGISAWIESPDCIDHKLPPA